LNRQPDKRTDRKLGGADNSVPPPAYLPDFCSSPIVFGVVLIAELTAIALTVARQTEWSSFFGDLAKTSLLLIWTSLAITATLCLLRTRLNRYSVVKASILTFATVIVIIAIVSEAIYWLGTTYQTPGMTVPNTWFPQNRWYFLSGNIVVGIIMTGLALRYFYVSHQWQRNVESEA